MALKPSLIDTAPLVAYLDRGDPKHDIVADFLHHFSAPLCTTTAVIAEAMYLLKDETTGSRRLAEFIHAARVHVFDFTQPEQLLAAVGLMEKYRRVPMDFADATLVLLAEEIHVRRIVTLDRRGFRSFRTRSGQPFEVMPA